MPSITSGTKPGLMAFTSPYEALIANPERPTISAKLNRIILPSLNLEKVSLQEALDYLRTLASNNDVTELDPANKGVNITLNLGPEGGPEVAKIQAKRFDLRLRSVPLSQALKYICEATDTMLATDDYAVTIRPVGSNSSEMISRNFRVPPDFLSSAGDSASSSAPAEDPFNSKPPAGGLLPTRRGAKEILQSSGINFPEGSSANFNAASNTLLIRNTPANIDLISQFVESVSKTEPVQVIVTVTMIRTEQRNLQELGFDWLLDQFGLGGGGFPPGTDAVTLSGGTQGTGGDLGDIALASSAASRKPITAGNRSGDGASSRDGIDDLIATNQQGFGTSSSRAPGVLAVNGLLNGTSLQAVMRGLDQKKGQDLMTTSSTVTRSGQSASVRVIREFIYPTEYEPPQLPNTVNSANGGVSPVTPATPKAFEKKDVGVIVEVLPTVSQDRHFVDIQLNPSIIDFDGFVNYGSPINSVGQATVFGRTASPIKLTANAILQPVFSVQRTNTHLTIADGATVVIGGLIQEKIQLVDDKTPILGNLPLVGRLFQSKVSAPTKKAIVFLVNVKLVDPTGRPINQP